MGGYSRRCALCAKWFTNPKALKAHGYDKHGKRWPDFESLTDFGVATARDAEKVARHARYGGRSSGKTLGLLLEQMRQLQGATPEEAAALLKTWREAHPGLAGAWAVIEKKLTRGAS